MKFSYCQGLANIRELLQEVHHQIQASNYGEASVTLHQIKGVAGNLRLTELVELVIRANSSLTSDSSESLRQLLLDMNQLIT